MSATHPDPGAKAAGIKNIKEYRMSRSILVILTIIFLPAFLPARQADVFVQQVINLVKSDSLVRNVRELSGDTTPKVNGSAVRIISRRRQTGGNTLAQSYLAERLTSYGLAVELQHYDASHPNTANVIGLQQGTTAARCTLIVCAHFDDIAPGDTVPGADDNGSGTATVLEAARILSKYTLPPTVVYALWNEEESGDIGSTAYAQRSSQRKDSIIGVINVDMIGFDSNNDGKSEIHTNNSSRSVALASLMNSVNTTYSIGLAPVTYKPGGSNSDHASFWLYGYGAIWLIEAYWSGDLNPGYHTVNDKIQKFNLGYFTKCAKLAIGTLANLINNQTPTSVDVPGELPENIALFQNFPNPFNPSTMIQYQIPKESYVLLTVFDPLGREISTLVNGTQSPGTKSITWNAGDLPGGVYFYRLRVGPFTQTKKLVVLR